MKHGSHSSAAIYKLYVLITPIWDFVCVWIIPQLLFFCGGKKDTDRERQRFVMTEENYECMFFSAVFLAICIFTNSLSITFPLILKLLFTTKLST